MERHNFEKIRLSRSCVNMGR
ncbi:hypothetical protein BN2475_80023 [Paraburkholderia ribeironis]|uniref:Uncharacterized protein n=1 Tax=Paraburkholderia ribeironis TaxID=1247936 RepID=A0A1N7RM55_9BURK|nr:hypothetical protein BN2475_80023 [Paraburkholderia ribeironis]